MTRLYLLFLAAFALAPRPCSAQVDVARSQIREGLALAAGGDTAAAISALRTAARDAPDLAEAHYQLGRLLARYASGHGPDPRLLEEAEMALLRATALAPENPDYLEQLDRLRGSERLTPEGRQVLDAMLEKASGSFSKAEQADLEYNLGRIEERNYERLRERRMVTPTRTPIATGFIGGSSFAGTPWLGRYVESYLANTPVIPGMGRSTRERMEQHYRAALRYEPNHLSAASRLMLLLLEENRLGEYISLARRLVDAHPDVATTHLYLGLGLHAAGREDDAAAAFDIALAKMSNDERAPFVSLEQVMRQQRAKSYGQLDDAGRSRFEDLFWRMSDPLYLTTANERRLEHLSRVAYADLRFSEPATGRRGWETERGIIFIRYGPPTVRAAVPGPVSQGGGNTIVWAYRGGPVFMFYQQPGYVHARFAGDYQWVAEEMRYVQPAAYTNIPSIPMLTEMPVQIARFRGASPDEVSVEIHTELPLEAMAAGLDLERGAIETGLFLLSPRGERIVERRDTTILEYTDASSRNTLRSWRLLLPATGKLIAAVEARDAATWRAGMARDTVSAELFSEDSLSLSDILLAESLRPLAIKPALRSEFDIAVNPSRRYAPNQPVVIYYELYGLQPDSEGFASYEVSLAVTLKSLNREGTILGGDRNPLAILGVLADAWGFSPVGDDRLELRFSRELDMKGRDRATEYHSLDLRKAPAGEYEITLKVWDALAQRLASRNRTFTVTREE